MFQSPFLKALLIGGALFINGTFVYSQNNKQPDDTTQHVVPGRINSVKQTEKPYVILISADGFRHDYTEKYQAENLKRLGSSGVRAEAMIPSYPTLTFPNHYTIVTGLYPAHHGLVNNTFYDKARDAKYSMGAKDKVTDGYYYGGTPLWVLAEKQQMLSASMFWVGSEAAVQDVKPTYSFNYTEQIPIDNRIQTVVQWLSLPANKRPHLITFYLNEPDHASHSFGPDSKETETAVKMVDQTILKLTEAVKKTGLPVNFIFLADHGMTAVDRENPLSLPTTIDLTKLNIPSSSTLVDIHVNKKEDILPTYEALKASEKDYKVYLKKDIPAKLHYSTEDDKYNRIGDIVVLPTWPKVFSRNKPGAGYHGFDPTIVKDMHATFMAWGPAFKTNMQIPAFENVNVYPLIADILGLKITDKIDGNISVLKNTLKK